MIFLGLSSGNIEFSALLLNIRMSYDKTFSFIAITFIRALWCVPNRRSTVLAILVLRQGIFISMVWYSFKKFSTFDQIGFSLFLVTGLFPTFLILMQSFGSIIRKCCVVSLGT